MTIRFTKFGKSREVPLHASTVAALTAYTRRRDELHPRPVMPAFFLSTAGTRLLYCNAHLAWRDLVRRAGLEPRSAKCRPRPHDLRHRFAVRTLLGWDRDGADVQARMPLRSTYLGHVHPSNTYWYLSAAPELLNLVAARLDALSENRHERARAHPAGLFHRADADPTSSEPEYGGLLSRHVPAAVGFRATPHRQASLEAGLRGSGRGADRRLPPASGT